MNRNQSSALMQRACRSIPGGVNSPVRAFKGVGGDPIFFDHADGAYLFDVDGINTLTTSARGPMVLGQSSTDNSCGSATSEQSLRFRRPH